MYHLDTLYSLSLSASSLLLKSCINQDIVNSLKNVYEAQFHPSIFQPKK